MTNREAAEQIQERIDHAVENSLERCVPEYVEALRLAVKALKQAEWRRPNEKQIPGFQEVLFTIKDKNTKKRRIDFGGLDRLSRTIIIFTRGDDNELHENEEVVAWMPLPKPFLKK